MVDTTGRMTAINPAAARIVAAIAGETIDARGQIRAIAIAAISDRTREPSLISVHLDGVLTCFQVTATPAKGMAVVVLRDVTAETSVREVLLESRQRYKHLIEVASDFVWECDETGRFSFVSEPGAFGYPPNRIVGRDPADFVEAATAPWPNLISAPVRDRIVELDDSTGRTVRLTLDAGPIYDHAGHQRGVRGIGRTLTDTPYQRPASAPDPEAGSEKSIAEITRAMRTEWHPDAILGRLVDAVRRTFRITGCGIRGWDDGVGWLTLAEAGTPAPESRIEPLIAALEDGSPHAQLRGPDGEIAGVAIRCHGRRVGVLTLWNSFGADRRYRGLTGNDLASLGELDPQCGIAASQALEMRRLTRLSRTDGLTNLLNRRAFLLELTAALARSKRHRTNGALLYIDLDQFKVLNDRSGHEAGNAVLIKVGEILAGAIRPYDLATRLGGDEFAVWLGDITARQAGRSARRIAHTIAAMPAQDDGLGLGASIGVAMFDPDRPESPDDLIDRADRAMYRAKKTPGEQVCLARRRPPAHQTG